MKPIKQAPNRRDESKRRCAFCGRSPVTREHVWPARVRRQLPEPPILAHTHTAWREGGEEQTYTYPQRVFDQTARIVCADCNNRWMSRIDKPPIARLHERNNLLGSYN